MSDTDRIDWLQKQLKNMDSSKGGTWLRIGDKGRIQIHRQEYPYNSPFVWNEDVCVMDSIPDATNDIRQAIDEAIAEKT